MDDLIEGRFDYEQYERNQENNHNNIIEFSCQNLALTLKKGETKEGSFIISNPVNTLVEGYVYSSELLVECLNKEFIGVREEIFYRFSSVGLEEGDSLEGQFYIITNFGEYEIPFRLDIERSIIPSSLGNIKNMFHFANLAKTNWEEAVKLFYSKEFRKLFESGTDKQYFCSYKGLSASYGNEQNMEEFLLEINKKQKIEYIPEKTEIIIEDPYDISEHSLTLSRNGWGHTALTIEGDAAFLRIDKEKISDDDFLGNAYRLTFYIESERLHAGRNYGAIHIYNSNVDITIPVTVIRNMEHKRILGIRKEKKQLLVQLIEFYVSYRAKKISSRIWMDETEKLVDRLTVLDGKDLQARLFQAQLLITQERFNEAEWLLEHIKEEMKGKEYSRENEVSPEMWCYYRYLTTLYRKEDGYVDEVAQKVERMYRANPGNWRIAWLMLYLSEEYSKSPSKRWLVLEEQYKRNCTSPVLYAEALHLLQMNPTLLMKLGAFEMQVLNFAVKRDLMTPDLIMHVRYLMTRLKSFSERAFFILKESYAKYPENETLQVISTLLIKGNKTGEQYFKWYSLSVEQELRITKLYEYYMMSLPTNYKEEIPKMVLMYFSYHSELDYKKNAFLYAYVYRRKEERPELYLNYYQQMERFVIDQVMKKRMNKDLAYLYHHVISPKMINEEIAKALTDILFMNQMTTENKEIRQVVVNYTISEEEFKYPVSNGSAWVPLYGSDYKMLLEDGKGNRYSVSVPYHIEQMMSSERLITFISPYVKEHIGLDIFLCKGEESEVTVIEANADRFRYMAKAVHVEENLKSEIRLKLLHYYYEQDYMLKLDQYLEELSPDRMEQRERNEIIRFLVLRGMYDKAFEWMVRFGLKGIEVRTMVRLCSRLISRDGLLEDGKMTYVIYYAYQEGKYDENLLSYLVHFYNGTSKQMQDLWKAAVAFDIEAYPLCERILVQMLFTGSSIEDRFEIFRNYVSGGAKTQIESLFLAKCSYDYFVRQEETDAFVFTDALRVYERGEGLEKICKLAFLKYYAENKDDITAKIRASVKTFLYEMLEESIYFNFFREYTNEMSIMGQFSDKTIIEYRANPGSKVSIRYELEKENGTKIEHKKEEMKDMYGGICVKSFVLFFGENLKYYIMEEVDGTENIVKQASISKSDIMQDVTENRFSMLNDIVVGKVLQDYQTVNYLLEEYYRKDYITSQMFHLR